MPQPAKILHVRILIPLAVIQVFTVTVIQLIMPTSVLVTFVNVPGISNAEMELVRKL